MLLIACKKGFKFFIPATISSEKTSVSVVNHPHLKLYISGTG